MWSQSKSRVGCTKQSSGRGIREEGHRARKGAEGDGKQRTNANVEGGGKFKSESQEVHHVGQRGRLGNLLAALGFGPPGKVCSPHLRKGDCPVGLGALIFRLSWSSQMSMGVEVRMCR